jgi:multiple sugar transport system substrate-binding protein
MKKLFSLCLVVVILVGVLAGCAPAPQATPVKEVVKETVKETVVVEKQVEITATPAPKEPVTLNWFTYSANPDHLEDMKKMIATFEAQNPGIKVNMETAPWADYFGLLKTKIASGEAPDVFELNYESFVEYASKGVLLDLNPQIAADKAFDKNIFYPRALNAFNYKGMQLGLPAKFDTVVLFYNKDLFDKAGVAYPTADWTYDDVIAASKKIQAAVPGVKGFYAPIQFWEFYKRAAQNGCELFNADMTQVTINSPACVDTVDKMVAMIKKEGIQPAEADMGGLKNEDLFEQGKLAMDVIGIWMFSRYQKATFNWDIQVEPGLKTKATHFFSDAFVTFAATKHPAEAWKWSQFLTSSKEMVDLRLETGWSLPALNKPELFDNYLKRDKPANRTAVFESLKYAVVPPVVTRQNELTQVVGSLLEKVTLGQLTSKEALDQAKTAIEELIK